MTEIRNVTISGIVISYRRRSLGSTRERAKRESTLAGVRQKRALVLRELLRNDVEIDGDCVVDRENGANQSEAALAERLLAVRHRVEKDDMSRQIERLDEQERIDSFHFGICG